MDIHRQRYSQLNSRFRQQHQRRSAASSFQPVQSSMAYPIVLPTAVRPQPRQQARSKQSQPTTSTFPPPSSTHRPTSSYGKHQYPSPSAPDQKYITLANLTKILQVLQTQAKVTDNESSTVMSSSTSNSAKQRVQQHLQETAMRWWKPIRSPDYLPAPPSIVRQSNSDVSTKVSASTVARPEQHPDNLPLLTIVSNSTRRFNFASANDNASSTNDGSDASVVSPSKGSHMKHLRQEPIIMQTQGRRLYTYDHFRYPNHVNFSPPRLIRQM